MAPLDILCIATPSLAVGYFVAAVAQSRARRIAEEIFHLDAKRLAAYEDVIFLVLDRVASSPSINDADRSAAEGLRQTIEAGARQRNAFLSTLATPDPLPEVGK